MHPAGIYLTCVHLTGVHLIAMHITGVCLAVVHLTGVRPTGVCPIEIYRAIVVIRFWRP